MHHIQQHNTRPPHVRHNVAQPRMHPQRPPNVNLGAVVPHQVPATAASIQQQQLAQQLQQQHHLTTLAASIPPGPGSSGGSVRVCHQQQISTGALIPPAHQRDLNRMGYHQNQRPNTQTPGQHSQMPAKIRSQNNNRTSNSNFPTNVNSTSQPPQQGQHFIALQMEKQTAGASVGGNCSVTQQQTVYHSSLTVNTTVSALQPQKISSSQQQTQSSQNSLQSQKNLTTNQKNLTNPTIIPTVSAQGGIPLKHSSTMKQLQMSNIQVSQNHQHIQQQYNQGSIKQHQPSLPYFAGIKNPQITQPLQPPLSNQAVSTNKPQQITTYKSQHQNISSKSYQSSVSQKHHQQQTLQKNSNTFNKNQFGKMNNPNYQKTTQITANNTHRGGIIQGQQKSAGQSKEQQNTLPNQQYFNKTASPRPPAVSQNSSSSAANLTVSHPSTLEGVATEKSITENEGTISAQSSSSLHLSTSQNNSEETKTKGGSNDSNQTKIANIYTKSSAMFHQNVNSTAAQQNKKVTDSNSRELSTEYLINSEQKYPMSLINELARFNKILHQYRLTGEEGPPHCRRFTVTLNLGEEEYTADGYSIKNAQHTAAAEAISKTKYRHPPVKSTRSKKGPLRFGNVAPTVELNALAMRLGDPPVYVYEPFNESCKNGNTIAQPTENQPPNALSDKRAQDNLSATSNIQNSNARFIMNSVPQNGHANQPFAYNRNYGVCNQRTFQNRRLSQKTFLKHKKFSAIRNQGHNEGPSRITLIIGKRKFVGIGATIQLAKHDAAARALEVLRPLVANEDSSNDLNDHKSTDGEADSKSPISLVHENAIKRNLLVTFEVKNERGPPHMRTFVTVCKVGDIVTEGEGNGKKISKRRAAEKMMKEIEKLPPLLTPTKIEKTVKNKPAKKLKDFPKDKAESGIVGEISPISKLIQIQHALKEAAPVFTVIEEKGNPRRRIFVMEVTANGKSAKGTGRNKKQAKKIAAKNLLIDMGYGSSNFKISSISDSTTNNNKENSSKLANINENSTNVRSQPLMNENVVSENTDKGTSISTQGGTGSRQIVPGLLIVQRENKSSEHNKAEKFDVTNSSRSVSMFKNATLESEIFDKDTTSATTSDNSRDGVRPKQQLLYLGKLLGFQAVFSDYPKGNHGEFLTIVTLSTDPPQICHGAGGDTEESQDKASMEALQLLSKLGLDNVKPKKPQPSVEEAVSKTDNNNKISSSDSSLEKI